MPPVLEIAVRALTIGSEILLVGAALHDVATRTVPNWMPLCLLVAGICLRLINGNLGWGLLAGLLVFVAAAFCWRRGWMGGADVKLFTASSVLVPPHLVFSMVLASSLAGGVLVLIYLVLRLFVGRPPAGRPANLLLRIWRVERRRIKRLESLPYASAIAVGTLTILFMV